MPQTYCLCILSREIENHINVCESQLKHYNAIESISRELALV
jgi:hypothetical protein